MRIAIEPVIAPAAILSAISSVLEATERVAAPRLGADHDPPSSQSGEPRAARPRWLIACFSSGLSSAIVRESPGPVSSGTNAGS